MTPLRVQKTAQMPLVQFTEKLVEVTVTMRTSSGSPSITTNSGDASDSGSGISSEWENTPTVQPTAPEGCRDDTGAVQRDEHAIQGQVPNIEKTDEILQAQFMSRRRTTNSNAETVPNAQEA